MDHSIDKDEDVSNWQEETNGDIELQPTKQQNQANIVVDSLSSNTRSYDISIVDEEKNNERQEQLQKLKEQQDRIKAEIELRKQKAQVEWDKLDLSVNPMEGYIQPNINNKEENFNKFKGKISIFGKFWTGNYQDRISQTFTALALITVCTHYYLFIGEWYYQTYGYAILKYFIIFPAVVIGYNVYRCFTTEPGVLPRSNLENDPTLWLEKYEMKQEELRKQQKSKNYQDESTNQENGSLINDEDEQLANISLDLNNDPNNLNFLQDKKDVDIKFYKYRYCRTCKIMRPPKSSHCQRCDMCVQTFDHHCFFIGNCVGARNIKYFLIFLINVMIFGNLILVLSGYMGFVQLQQNENIMVEIDKYPKSKYFFLSGLFLYFWRSCCGCPRRMHSLVGNYCGVATIVLLFQVGSSFQDLITGSNDGEDGEMNNNLGNTMDNTEYSYYELYKSNPLAPIFQFVATMSVLGIATPLGCSTLFNVSRGITTKEKVQLDDSTRFQYSYDLTNKQIIQNMIQFIKYKKPESYMY